MYKITYLLSITISILLVVGCSDDDLDRDSSLGNTISTLDSSGGFGSSASESSASGGTVTEEPNNTGLITAGEWNDLDDWSFWTDIQLDSVFIELNGYWELSVDNRISVAVLNGSNPIINARVELRNDSETVWSTMTDNFGKAELWLNIFDQNDGQISDDYSIYVNGERKGNAQLYNEVGTIKLQSNTQNFSNKVELSFVVDATGSMGDELEFLKDDLQNVIEEVASNNSRLDIHTSAVFYRDEGDEYVIRESNFASNLSTTINFIKDQSAGGGGDYPEAVHSGLTKAINEFNWSEDAITKITFLLLDAPPHHNPQVINQLHESIQVASEKGIKIIPITASGIQKDTELLMRHMSIATNSTYVFITNDSGIGNNHITATVGDYEVEFLNDLMVRLITKYSE